MSSDLTLTNEVLEGEVEGLYHHVQCEQLEWLQIKLTKEGRAHKRSFAILGLSSKETIRTGLQAVDASPFKTVFVVEEESGKVLFALSKNEEYVELAGKKKKKPGDAPPPPPPPPPAGSCCEKCMAHPTAYECIPIGDNLCICKHQSGGSVGGDINLDDALETWA